jgi:hypothetical protein
MANPNIHPNTKLPSVDGAGKWIAAIDASLTLEPTHWCPPPDVPA